MSLSGYMRCKVRGYTYKRSHLVALRRRRFGRVIHYHDQPSHHPSLFRVVDRFVGNLQPMPGVLPDYPAPVIRDTEAGIEMTLMRWGRPPKWRTGDAANIGLVQRAPMGRIEVGLLIKVLQLGLETLVDQEECL